jgi:thiamine-monophosphate kinase
MTSESAFIALMRGIADTPAARGLLDDAAIVECGGEALVLTHDMMAEDVHWLPQSDPADIAWKLVASNLSDLASKGARPVGVLLGFALGDDQWDRRFAEGLEIALRHFSVPLLGGDTVANRGDKRNIGMTAIGMATHQPVPSRIGAKAGDALYVTGTLGDALAAFEMIEAGFQPLSAAYDRPAPRLAEGRALAPLVSAMMDVSDGLLIDSNRLAMASRLAVHIELNAIPLSDSYRQYRGQSVDSLLQAASWGDDYELLFTAPADVDLPVAATRVGVVERGSGLTLSRDGDPVPLPASLGYEHR